MAFLVLKSPSLRFPYIFTLQRNLHISTYNISSPSPRFQFHSKRVPQYDNPYPKPLSPILLHSCPHCHGGNSSRQPFDQTWLLLWNCEFPCYLYRWFHGYFSGTNILLTWVCVVGWFRDWCMWIWCWCGFSFRFVYIDFFSYFLFL